MAELKDSWRGGGRGKGTYLFTPSSLATVPMTIQGLTGQVANLLEIKNVAGTVVFSVSPAGDVTYLGDEIISDALTVNGNILGHGTLTIDGVSTLTGAVLAQSTLNVAGRATLDGGITVTGDSTIEGTTTIHSLFVEGELVMNSGYIRSRYSANLYLYPSPSTIVVVGAINNTSHSLNTNSDMFINGKLEVDGVTYLDGGATVIDDQYIYFGSSNDAGIGWNTTQVVDGWYFGTSDGQNTLIIAELGDIAYDFAHGAQTNPTVFIQSATQSATQWGSLAHNQTDFLLQAGTGSTRVLRSSAVDGSLTALIGDVQSTAATGGNDILIGVDSQATYNLNAATLLSRYGFNVTNMTITAGTVTNQYGYYCPALTGATNNYAFYANDNMSLFSHSSAASGEATLWATMTPTATTGAVSFYAQYIQTVDNAVVTAGAHTDYGIYCATTKAGADTSVDVTTLYSGYFVATNTGSGAFGTKNTYAGYFSATGDAAGTSTTYGIYTTASGADTNYALYSAGRNYMIYSPAANGQATLVVSSTPTSTTGAVTTYGLYNQITDSVVVTAGAHIDYGTWTSITKSGADTSVDTTTIYGTYSSATQTGSGDFGTRVTYGGYFVAVGDTAGTATTYGIYASATGSDTNYALYTDLGSIKNVMGATQSFTIDAGATDHTSGNVLYMDLDVNSASVNGFEFDVDVGTALSVGERVTGVYVNIDGNAGDNAASYMSAYYATSANTTAGINSVLEIGGTWDYWIQASGFTWANSGAVGTMTQSSSVDGSVTGLSIAANSTGATGNNDTLTSFKSTSTYNLNAATLQNRIAYNLDNIVITAGTVTNQYGYYCPALSGATNNYSFYSAGGKLVFVMGATDNISIEATATDHTLSNVVAIATDCNSASVDSLNILNRVGTALSAGEIFNGVYIDINGLAGDEATSQNNAISLTSANATGGINTAIRIAGTWDSLLTFPNGTTWNEDANRVYVQANGDTFDFLNEAGTAYGTIRLGTINKTFTTDADGTTVTVTGTDQAMAGNDNTFAQIIVNAVKNTGVGVLANRFGITINNMTITTGSVTRQDGLHINALSGATTNYGIYSDVNSHYLTFGATNNITFDAGSIDHTGSNVMYMDLDVNSSNVRGFEFDIDVGTALSDGEAVSGVYVDIDGNAGDSATSNMYGVYLTSANTTAGNNYGLYVTGTFDYGIYSLNQQVILQVGTNQTIYIDAGATDHSGSQVMNFDVDVNSASVNALKFDVDVGTALSAGEIVNSISIDIDGLAGDDATSQNNGIAFTSTNATGGLNTAIKFGGTFDYLMMNGTYSSGSYSALFEDSTSATWRKSSALDASITGFVVDVRSGGATGDNDSMTGLNIIGTFSTAGTLQNYYGINISNVTKTGTTITNNYGLYVAAQTSGGINYGIYSLARQAIAYTTASANDYSLSLVTTQTSATGKTQYSLYNTVTDSTVKTGTDHVSYGSYTTNTKTGADTSVDTISIYGTYSAASQTGSGNFGTRVTYGGYFSATGDTAGTSTAYGIYATATGADTNYSIYGVGNTFINGYTSIGMGATPVSGVVLFAGANATAMPAGTTAWRHLQTGGNITELAGAAITDIVGAYFNTFTITDGGGIETVGFVSTVYIAGAPTAGTAPSIGTYALFIDAGAVRIDGATTLGTDLTIYEATNDANPNIFLGSAATERLEITATYAAGTQTLQTVNFVTATASATADYGAYSFNVDGSVIALIDDGGMEITGNVNATAGFTDGTMTIDGSGAITGVTSLAMGGALSGVTTLGMAGDLTDYEAVNDGNPEIRLGSADAEELHIQANYTGGAQTLVNVTFTTDTSLAGADAGQYIFNVDGTNILAIDDGGLEVTGSVNATTGFTDGTMTIDGSGAITGVTSLAMGGALSGVTTLGLVGDLTMYDANNDGNPQILIGSSAAEQVSIQAVYVAGGQLLDYVKFTTTEASATADRGRYIFNVDAVDILTIADAGLTIANTIAGAGIDLNITGTAYTTLVGGIDIVRSGNLTGVNTETILDLNIKPSFTLTEPAAGTFNYFGASIDMSAVSVTAGDGTSVISALYLVANADADVGTNYALFVDAGTCRFDGDFNLGATSGTTTFQTASTAGVARAIHFDIPVGAGGAGDAAIDYQFKLDGVLEAGLLAETDGAGTYRQPVWKIPYQTADYGAAWVNIAAALPAPASLANGSMVVALNTTGGETRLYVYSGAAWKYVLMS